MIAAVLVSRGRYLVAEPFFTPGLPLAIGKRGSVPAHAGELVLVAPAPHGGRAQVLERLGSPRDLDAVMHALAAEGGAARAFPDDALAEVEALPADPPPPAGERRDLRGGLAFTVDPGTARDHDDAVEVVREGDALRVRVHIADVAAVVAEGGALDAEARRRAFSLYLPGRVDPMLPPALSTGLCSLVPDRPRDVVTVEVPFGPDLEPGRPSVFRAQIRSARRFAYEEVEAILAGGGDCASALRTALADADRVSQALRARRHARGALFLGTRELDLRLADGRVAEARLIGEPAAHALVEELMILANEQVAELLARRRAPALYRVHAAPEPDSAERLYAQLAELDVPTPPLPEELAPRGAAVALSAAAASVQAHARARGVAGEAWLSLVLRAAMQARYAPHNGGHSALATPAYCHFTSPIRRYPDVTIHRALLAALGLVPQPHPDEELDDVAAEVSLREREWADLERRGDRICLAAVLEERLRSAPEAEHVGEITGLIGGGLFVRFDALYEGFVPSRTLGREFFEVSELGTALVGREGRRFRLGDELRVHVERVDVPAGRVTLRPVDGPEPPRPAPARPAGRRPRLSSGR